MVGPYSSHYTSYDDYSSLSPSVDCTLSLGTPSTRRASNSDDQHRRGLGSDGYSGWDVHHQSEQQASSRAAGVHHRSRSHRGGSSSGGGGGGDTLPARRCANCDTTATPLWRNGPRGPKSLCNACGIRYKKEERRANAAATANVAVGGVSYEETEDNHTAATGYYDGTTSSWSHQYFPPVATTMGNEYGFIGDVDGRDSDPGLQFATWHYSVTGQAYQDC